MCGGGTKGGRENVHSFMTFWEWTASPNEATAVICNVSLRVKIGFRLFEAVCSVWVASHALRVSRCNPSKSSLQSLLLLLLLLLQNQIRIIVIVVASVIWGWLAGSIMVIGQTGCCRYELGNESFTCHPLLLPRAF